MILTQDYNKKDEQYTRFYMKREIIRNQIIDTLDAIIEQTQEIHQHKARIPQIEIDIVKKNIADLYELYHLLDKINHNSENIDIPQIETPKPETVQPKKTKIEKTIEVVEPKKEISEKIIPEIEKTTPEPILETPIKTPESVTKPEFNSNAITLETQSEPIKIEPEIITKKIEDSEKLIPDVKPEIQPKIETKNSLINPNATTIADKFKSDKKTLNDSIENSDDKSIVSKMQKAPITDLVKAIGLNERFLFIKELFKNDSDQYSISIKALNEMDSLMHAFDYLDELKTKLDWDENSSACLKIYDLIRRKYQPKT